MRSGGIGIDHALLEEEPEEGAGRGDLAREARLRVRQAAQLEPEVLDVAFGDARPTDAVVRSAEDGLHLREVAPVCGDGVGGERALRAQMAEEPLDLLVGFSARRFPRFGYSRTSSVPPVPVLVCWDRPPQTRRRSLQAPSGRGGDRMTAPFDPVLTWVGSGHDGGHARGRRPLPARGGGGSPRASGRSTPSVLAAVFRRHPRALGYCTWPITGTSTGTRRWRALYLWEGGLSLWGGVIGGLAAGLVRAKRCGLSVPRTADAVVVPGLVGLGDRTGGGICSPVRRVAAESSPSVGARLRETRMLRRSRGGAGRGTPVPFYEIVLDMAIAAFVLSVGAPSADGGPVMPVALGAWAVGRFVIGLVRMEPDRLGLQQTQVGGAHRDRVRRSLGVGFAAAALLRGGRRRPRQGRDGARWAAGRMRCT